MLSQSRAISTSVVAPLSTSQLSTQSTSAVAAATVSSTACSTSAISSAELSTSFTTVRSGPAVVPVSLPFVWRHLYAIFTRRLQVVQVD